MIARHRAVLPLTIALAAFFFCVAWLRHQHYGTHALDLGAYENSFWNLAHRGVPWNSVEGTHQWGNHFEIGLLWLWLPYRLAPSPVWLLLLQAITLAACVLPIEALARDVLGDRERALQVAIATAIAPQLILANLYDFHALTPCALAMATLALGIERDRSWMIWLSALVAVSLREQMALAMAAAGAAWVLRHGVRRLGQGIALVAVGVSAFLLIVVVIIPRYAGGGTFRYAASYGRLGGSPGAAARFLIEHPLRFVALPFEGGRKLYLLELAAGATLFSLAALRSRRTAWPLVIAAPLLLVQLLNDRREIWHLDFHYGAPVVPLLAAAAVLALPRFPVQAVRVWIAVTTVVALLRVPRVVAIPQGPLDFAFATSARAGALREAAALIPAGAAISAQADIVPHLADRPEIHAWPRIDATDAWILLDADGMESDHSVRPAIEAAIIALRSSPEWRVRLDRERVLLVERAGPSASQ